MGTKPAKVAHLLSLRPTKAAGLTGLFPVTEDLLAKRVALRGRTKVAKVMGPRWARGQICYSRVPPIPYAYYVVPPGGEASIKRDL